MASAVREVMHDVDGADQDRRLSSVPIELLALGFVSLSNANLLVVRAVCRAWRQLCSTEELWHPRLHSYLKALAEVSPRYAECIEERHRAGTPAYQCCWIASRLVRAPSQSAVCAEFERRSMGAHIGVGSAQVRIRSYHLLALLRSLHWDPDDADLVEMVEYLDTDSLGWVGVDDFLAWLVMDECWLLDRAPTAAGRG